MQEEKSSMINLHHPENKQYIKKTIMKKTIIYLLIVLLTFPCIAFAGNDKPGKPVLLTFQHKFPHAANTTWSKSAELFIARFTLDSKTRLAYFEDNGKFIGSAEYVSLDLIPIAAQLTLLKRDPVAVINFILKYTPNGDTPVFFARFQNDKKTWIDEVNNQGEIKRIRTKKIFQTIIN